MNTASYSGAYFATPTIISSVYPAAYENSLCAVGTDIGVVGSEVYIGGVILFVGAHRGSVF